MVTCDSALASRRSTTGPGSIACAICSRRCRSPPVHDAPEFSLVLIGFGNVARRFIRLLGEAADRVDFTWKVVAIATRRHGSVVDADGVDTHRALAAVAAGQSLERLDPSPRQRSAIDVIRQVTDELADDAAEGRLVC